MLNQSPRCVELKSLIATYFAELIELEVGKSLGWTVMKPTR